MYGEAGRECSCCPGGHPCCQPVPELRSSSPRRYTLSLCVDRQQSHSVLEKEACVSCLPQSTGMDIQMAHSLASPASSLTLPAAATSNGFRQPRQHDLEPHPSLGTAWAFYFSLPPPPTPFLPSAWSWVITLSLGLELTHLLWGKE